MTEQRKQQAKCTQDIFQRIVDALHTGTTLAKFLLDNENDPNIPSRSCIMAFVNADNANKAVYARAREDCADALAEQVITEADSTTTDPARASNRMKARQFLASKLKPKVYGDKLDVDIKGTLDVGAAILAARQRARLEPLTIDNEVDPFS